MFLVESGPGRMMSFWIVLLFREKRAHKINQNIQAIDPSNHGFAPRLKPDPQNVAGNDALILSLQTIAGVELGLGGSGLGGGGGIGGGKYVPPAMRAAAARARAEAEAAALRGTEGDQQASHPWPPSAVPPQIDVSFQTPQKGSNRTHDDSSDDDDSGGAGGTDAGDVHEDER